MKTINRAHALTALVVELVLTLCICLAIAAANLNIVRTQVAKYTDDIALDYTSLADRYISVFKVLAVQVKEKIQTDPALDEMQGWLRGHDQDFADAVGKDVYDGFAMTYKGGYARSWNYGDYTHYDPNSRPWYQEAAGAQGEAVVVAPYFSYLGASKLKADQVIIMTVAQRYSDTISLDLDLKIGKLDKLVARHTPYYDGTRTLFLNKDGYILSATDKKLYAYGLQEADSPISESLRTALQHLRQQPENLQYLQVDGRPYLAYAQVDAKENLYVALTPFWGIFMRRLAWIIVIFLGLAALEIWIYNRHKHALIELSEHDQQILRALAFYFDGVYVGSVKTDKFTVIKADKYYEQEIKTDLSQQEIFTRMAEHQMSAASRQQFLATVTVDKVKALLDKGQSFTMELEMQDGHWQNLRLIRNEDYAASGEFVFCVENMDKEIQQREKLAAAVTAAEQANAAKSEFVSRISHDIRTPIGIINNMTDFALQDAGDREKLTHDLERIKSSGAFLLSLINDVLDISKVDSGKIKLNPEPYYYDEHRDNIKELLETMCREKGLRYHYERRRKTGVIVADKIRLNQIILNLLSNAVKYTPAGGTVSYISDSEDLPDAKTRFGFEIHDTGIGMSEAFQRQMFEPFSQEYDNPQRPQGIIGTGLGLYIVKRLVDLMGGQLEVSSKQGQGTVVKCHIVFPDAARDTAYQAQLERRQQQAAPLQLQGHLLIAEDNPVNTEIAKRILTSFGLTADHAADGSQAVEMFQQAAPGFYQAILMDIQMPKLNGYEATQKIRSLEHPEAKTIPIIAMTADAFADARNKGLKAGMNAYLVKPLQPDLLRQTLSKYL